MKAKFKWMVESASGTLTQHKDKAECEAQAAWSNGKVKRVKVLS